MYTKRVLYWQMKELIQIGKVKIIREVYLFGSFARGDYDQNSDIDILIVIDDCSETEYVELKECFAGLLNIPISWISVYRISKILKMYDNGSYFLWHIKKEGKMIFSRENQLSQLLCTLPQYKNVFRDLNEYIEILQDVIAETNNKIICVEYELSVVASLVRNTCIAIAYMNGNMEFGRNSAVMYCFRKYGITIDLQEYEELYKYRLYQTGKIAEVPKGSVDLLDKWIKTEKELLEIAKKGVVDYEKRFMSGME